VKLFADPVEPREPKRSLVVGNVARKPGRRCERCGNAMACSGDPDAYERAGLCGWCEHMFEKMLAE
jgi:hypothetical protein